MARFHDIPVTSANWIHELAQAETRVGADQISIGASFDPQQLIEESTVEFLTRIRDSIHEHAKVFNSYSENGTRYQDVKIYSLTSGASDFMLYRNQVKLIFCNTAHGVVQISFSRHLRTGGSVTAQTANPNDLQGQQSLGQPQEMRARIGAFHDVCWTFEGEKVEAEQVAKYFFTEFVRVTRDLRRSNAKNQVLLDQIKSLLQDRGLDL